MTLEEADITYLKIANVFSTNSKAKRAKVGCVIVNHGRIISDGYNGTPSGFDNVCEDEHGKTKTIVLHAESNAISKLAKHGSVGAAGSTLYCTYSPCIECAKLIVQAGITRVVFEHEYRSSEGLQLLEQANVQYLQIDTYDEMTIRIQDLEKMFCDEHKNELHLDTEHCIICHKQLSNQE